jgi:tRNA (pseudouridine54-N1)-methyltransferase
VRREAGRIRRFLVLVHRVPVDGDFTLNDLAGSGGRMDEVAAVVTATFLVSNGIRRDTELTLLISSDPSRARVLRLTGSRLRFLNPDERSTAALLKNALVRSWTRPQEMMETTPGIVVGPSRPLEDLREFLSAPGAWWVTEEGGPFAEAVAAIPAGDLRVALSDPYDPIEAEREVLRGSGARQVSLGPISLRSSHCIVLLHNRFDLLAPPTGARAGASPGELSSKGPARGS